MTAAVPADTLDWTDRVLDLDVGAVAHGGHCVARVRVDDGGERVVFVRHALPGERVRAVVTEDGGGAFCRADAIAVLDPAPGRVEPPCPWAHPGACGGCDLQHVAGEAQLRWKSEVVNEQLRRLAGLGDAEVRVEALPPASSRPDSDARLPSRPLDDASPAEVRAGDVERLLGWRTRVRYAVDAAGRAGLLQHRSHQVVRIDRCRIAHPAIQKLDLLAREWPDADAVEAIASGGGTWRWSRTRPGGGLGRPTI